MIGSLEGTLAEKSPDVVAIDVGGVGYEVRVPLSTFLELPDEGKTVRLRIHTHVREDQLQLYGFLTPEERKGFRLFLGISGVGPRLALAILSGLPVPKLVQAIRREDVSALNGIPGVGMKTAQRIVVDLRDKLTDFEVAEHVAAETETEQATVSALLNLGYPRAQAERALRRALERLPDTPALEDLIREALRVAAR
ncbi:MAG: Holliday junction branch migration protein RuvA [Myxococcota bacterium]